MCHLRGGEIGMNARRIVLCGALVVSLQAASLGRVPPADHPERFQPPSRTIELKSPLLAFGMSFLIPGLGQYYNGHYFKGAIQTGVFAAGIIVMLTMGTETHYSSGAYTDYSRYGTFTYYRPSSENELSTMFYVGAGVAAASWLWSIIDAPLSTSSINERRREQQRYGHMYELGGERYALGMDVVPVREGIAVQLVMHF